MGPVACLCRPGQAAYLALHNRIAEISSLVALTATALGLAWIIEQPLSSLLFRFAPIRDAIKNCNAKTINFQMSAFGGDSPKPLRLTGTPSWLLTFETAARERLRSSATPKKRLATKEESGGFTGKQSELTASSAYTFALGIAIALAITRMDAKQIVTELRRRGL